MTTLIAASPEARKSYSITEKVRILNDLDAMGGWIGRIANAHGIPQSCLRKWNKNRASLEEMAGQLGCRARRVSDKRKPIHGDVIENHLLAFVDSRRDNSFHVTPRMLVAEWTKVDPDGVAALSVNAARARIYRFMRRNELSFCCTTHQAQVTQTDPQIITDFLSYCNWKAKLFGIAPECIANFDETNVYFSPPIRSTIAHKGSRTVTIRTPDSNNRCTAMLGVTMSGYKFPPHIIYQCDVNWLKHVQIITPLDLSISVRRRHGWMRVQCYSGLRPCRSHSPNKLIGLRLCYYWIGHLRMSSLLLKQQSPAAILITSGTCVVPSHYPIFI